MPLRACAIAVSLAVSAAFAWLGFTTTANGLASGSGLVAAAGFVFFCYALASVVLLVGAWVTGAPRLRRLAVVLAAIPLSTWVVAALDLDDISHVEMIYLLAMLLLLALGVAGIGILTRRPGADHHTQAGPDPPA